MAAGSQVSMAELLDQQQKIVNELAGKFTNIMLLAASSGEDVTGQEAAGKTLSINVETQGLIHAAEEFLTFNRQLKDLWLAGDIRELGEGEEDDVKNMNTNATKVASWVEQLIQNRNGKVASAVMDALHDRNTSGNIEKVINRVDAVEAAQAIQSLGAEEKRRDGDGDVEME